MMFWTFKKFDPKEFQLWERGPRDVISARRRRESREFIISHSEVVTVYKPGRELSPELSYAVILISEF